MSWGRDGRGSDRSAAPAVPVVAFVNNHFAGYAHETVRQRREMVDREAAS